MNDPIAEPKLNRRTLIGAGAGMVLVSAIPLRASAAPEDMQAAIRELFGTREITEDRVTLSLPPIAENGYSVPLTIDVDSPMSAHDYVQRIAVFSPRNPLPNITRFKLSPRSGRARVETRIRLGGSQIVQAIAEMSDGSLWSGSAEAVVTLAACVVL